MERNYVTVTLCIGDMCGRPTERCRTICITVIHTVQCIADRQKQTRKTEAYKQRYDENWVNSRDRLIEYQLRLG